MAYYTNPIRAGTDLVASAGDGHTITVTWFQAWPKVITNKVAYHIYYSTIKENVFDEGVKFLSYDGSLEANIIDLTPGQEYFFAVRPLEYNPLTFNPASDLLTAHDNLKYYPISILRQNMTETDLIVPLLDTDGFPNSGIVRVGVELIQYLSIDFVNKNLVLTDISQRGVQGTYALPHFISGFDGYSMWDPTIRFFVIGEDTIYDRIFACQSRFEYPNNAFNLIDGYRQVAKDLLSSDLSESDAENVNFPMYDYSGYHRTDPVLLLNGTCVGSYIGGEMGCIDGYGVSHILRGFSLQDQNTQRQEVQLTVDGRPAVLIKRVQTGIVCSCYLASSEYPDERCPYCYGTKFVVGYEQYYNPRRSDGRILVRPGPTDEVTKMYEAGLESEFSLSLWTLTVPAIKNRDILVLFDIKDNEEFRYEVLSVTRNNTILGQQGGQLLKVMRIRKTDVAYQIRIFRNTEKFPTNLNTSIGFVTGIPPHTHTIRINENTTSISQINQITSVNQGHNHEVVDGVIQPALGHTHTILLP